MKFKGNKTIIGAVCFMICFLLFAQSVFAYGLIDTQREASLTLNFEFNGRKAQGTVFKLYKAAEVSALCSFTPAEKFDKYPLSLEGLDSEEWRALAQTMAGYAAADKIKADASLKTDADGKCVFDKLSPGLYLVTGNSYKFAGYTYTPNPFLVCLPNYEDDAWKYDVEAMVKYDETHDSGGRSNVIRRALKAWKNDKKESRPEAVSVTLLRDGEAYDTVELNEDNNWRYSWNRLDSGHEWQLVENSVFEDYTVTVEREGITFLVTNTFKAPEEPTEPTEPKEPKEPTEPKGPDEPDKPTEPKGPDGPQDPDKPDDPNNPDNPDNPNNPDDPNNPDNPDNPNNPDNPDNPNDPNNPDRPNIPIISDDPNLTYNDSLTQAEQAEPSVPSSEKLPQTGMLWWPVPFLAMGGIVLILAGRLMRQGGGDGDE